MSQSVAAPCQSRRVAEMAEFELAAQDIAPRVSRLVRLTCLNVSHARIFARFVAHVLLAQFDGPAQRLETQTSVFFLSAVILEIQIHLTGIKYFSHLHRSGHFKVTT